MKDEFNADKLNIKGVALRIKNEFTGLNMVFALPKPAKHSDLQDIIHDTFNVFPFDLGTVEEGFFIGNNIFLDKAAAVRSLTYLGLKDVTVENVTSISLW